MKKVSSKDGEKEAEKEGEKTDENTSQVGFHNFINYFLQTFTKKQVPQICPTFVLISAWCVGGTNMKQKYIPNRRVRQLRRKARMTRKTLNNAGAIGSPLFGRISIFDVIGLS